MILVINYIFENILVGEVILKTVECKHGASLRFLKRVVVSSNEKFFPQGES